MKKRTWIYAQHPTVYEISCDKCQGTNIDWSEYEHRIWCYDCKIDTVGNEGVFSGPIPMGLSELMGIWFDRIYLKTGKMYKPVTAKDGKLIVYRYGGKELEKKYKKVSGRKG